MYDIEKAKLTEMVLNEILINNRLLKEIENLKRKNKELSKKLNCADKDNLTGLYNRSIADEAYLKAQTVIMCDIDDFKLLNDNYGHNFGDVVLKAISKILMDNVRNSDYVIRWGGEEFILFIDHQDIEVATKLAERIRNKVEFLEGMELEDGTICPKITMSFGVAKLHKTSSITEDIKEVDEALYKSKQNGKNIVTVLSDITNKSYVKRLKM